MILVLNYSTLVSRASTPGLTNSDPYCDQPTIHGMVIILNITSSPQGRKYSSIGASIRMHWHTQIPMHPAKKSNITQYDIQREQNIFTAGPGVCWVNETTKAPFCGHQMAMLSLQLTPDLDIKGNNSILVFAEYISISVWLCLDSLWSIPQDYF